MNNTEKNRVIDKSNIFSLLLMYALGALFIYCFSYSTSRLYPYFFGNDSAHFMTIGRAWLFGKIPYRDLFDHKGPAIYWIDMVGYAIGGNKYGIAIIQFIAICVSLTAVFQISQLKLKNNLYGIATGVITLVLMKNNYQEGNSVEEYCLPFLFWSAYGLIKYYEEDVDEHKSFFSLIYGLTFGICLTTRVTNIVAICGGIFVVYIILLLKGKYYNLIMNIVSFVIGLGLILIPFLVYFHSRESMEEMIYDSLFFNFKYAKGCPSWILDAKIKDYISFAKNYFLYLLTFVLSIFTFLRKKYSLAIAWIITACAQTYLFMNGYAWKQYPLVCLINVVLILNECVDLFYSEDKRKRSLSIVLMIITGIMMLFFLRSGIKEAVETYKKYSTKETRPWEELFDEIPEEGRNSFVSYGGNELKESYLLCDVLPCYKYYMIQEWITSFDEKLRLEMRQIYSSGNAEWILSGDYWAPSIREYLDRDYEVYDERNGYILYHKKHLR